MNIIREAMKNLPGHWYKGNVADGKGNYCGLGHLAEVVQYNFDVMTSHSFDLLNEVAGEQYPDRIDFKTVGDSLFANFNDHPDTTEDEVLRVMEKAAIRLDEEQGLTD